MVIIVSDLILNGIIQKTTHNNSFFF